MATTTTYSLNTTLSETIANTWTLFDQLLPDVIGLTNGGYVVAYNNDNSADGYVMLDFFDASSSVIGNYKIPFDGLTSAIGKPSITQLANGNVLVVWNDNETSNEGLKGTLFTADGTIIGSEFPLSGISPFYITPDVTALTSGGFVISFFSGGSSYVNIYNNAGVQQGVSIPVEAIVGGSQVDPVVTGLADGGFAVTFLDVGADGIYTRTFDADGTARTAAELLVGAAIWDTPPAIAALPNGRYAIAYSSTGWVSEGGTSGITLVLVNADGTPGTYIKVNDPTNGAGENEAEPAITVLDNGFIVVTWTYPFTPTDGDIHARIFDQSGNAITIGGNAGDFVLTNSTTDDVASAVSVLLAGEFVTVWQDSINLDGSGGGITRVENELVRKSVGDGASDIITGDQLRDIMKGKGDYDFLDGKGGNDTLFGGSGNDELFGGKGNDTLKGGADRDTLEGGAGGDMLKGGKGKDQLYGGKGKDQLFGDNGDDELYGGKGNDDLHGGKGNDKLTGDGGKDWFFFVNKCDKDKVLDFQNNKDTIVLGANLWSGNKTVSQVLNQFGTQNGNDFVFDFGGGDILIIKNTTKSQLQNDIDFI